VCQFKLDDKQAV